MADFATSAAAGTVGNLATEYAAPYVSYFFRFGKIVEDFKKRRKELELRKDRIQNDVDEAIRRTEVIEKDVEDWLMRADKELEEAQNLVDGIERGSKCFSWCPNWGWRCCLSKKVAKKTLSISELVQTPDFPRVGRRAPLEGIEFLLSDDHDFSPSESSKAAFSGIIRALKSDDVNMVGLYGMPGVGKTTLAEQVGKQAREQKLFDKVVIFTVSQTPNINKIQDEIAKVLGPKLEAPTDKGRAEELLRRLKGEQKILIIIDDVWDRMELKHIGIPLGDDHKGCKILLTTRRQQLCTQMNCQKKFKLDTLSEAEAWALFKNNAGLENASPTLIDVAEEVARECKGLPLAIITMARALKDETLDGWKVVNQRLKESRHSDNEDVCGDIYSSLEISYDYLQGNINSRSSKKEKGINKSQQCLLLCSLFAEDYEIGLEELTMYGVGQGMFDDVNSIEDARGEMSSLITNLQKSGLLSETSGVKFSEIHDVGIAKIHDVVRDFVHWMTSKGENMLVVKSGLKEWPRIRSESLTCCTAISLINSEINNFPDSLEFPKLEAFLMDGKRFSNSMVPSTFLQGMKVLKVLVLKNVSLSLEDHQFLPNLRALHLDQCELKNVSSLGNLKKLEILVISNSHLRLHTDKYYKELFRGLTELTTLRLLVLYERTGKDFTLSKNLLSSLVQLEELHLLLRIKWASIGEEGANVAGLSELSLLSRSRLTQLSLRVSPECIPKGFVFHPLQRFNIAVIVPEDYFFWYNWQHRSSRRLTITKKFSSNTFKELFCNVEDLTLGDVMHLEYFIDATKEQLPESAFSNLVRLTLDNMICLKELCHELPSIVFLHKLEYLTIKRCTNLDFELATSLPNLKELELEQCGQVQVIFQTDRDRVLLQASEEIRTPLLSSLRHLRLVSLPELKSMGKGPTDHVSLQGLKYVTVSRCNKIKFVFSLSIAQTLKHLQGLDVSDCDGVEQVFYCEEQTDDGKDITLPQLYTLELKSLRSLRNFYSENYFVKLPSLKTLAVSNCGELTHFKDELGVSATKDELETLDVDVHIFKEIFCNPKYLTLHGKVSQKSLAGDAFQGRLNEVTELQLESCNDLECLIEQTQELNNDDHSPKRLLPKLKELTVKNCKDMVSLLPATINLEEVVAESCVQLQVIFQMEGSIPTGEKNQEMLQLSNLKDLKLQLLPELKCIWKGPTRHVNLQSLKFMTIIRCDKLTSLFSTSLAQTLLHLEELQIQSCKKLEHLISTEPGRDDHETVSCNISLPQLHSLELEDLENLSSLCPRNYFVMAPSLENFNVLNCPKFTHDTWRHHRYGEKGSKLYALKEMICCSKNLTLSRSIGCQNLIADVDPERLNELTSIQLHNVGNVECLYDATEHRQPTVAFSNLKELVMEEMSGLRCIWKGPTDHINLQSLKVMIIKRCDKLTFLFSPSLAQTLLHLEELKIQSCKELEHIISSELGRDDHGTVKWNILLPRLRVFKLGDLENLSSLCPRNYFVMSPSLKEFSVHNCPKLTHEVWYNRYGEKGSELFAFKQMICCSKNPIGFQNLIPDVDPEGLNELTIIQLHNVGNVECLYDITKHRQPTVAFSNLVKLLMKEMIGLKKLCDNPPPKGFLQKLEKLEITNCMNLASLSPVGQNLKKVEIKNCCQLREIFKVDDILQNSEGNQGPLMSDLTWLDLELLSELRCIWTGPSHSVINLGSLKIVNISNCKRLRCVFSPSLVKSLVHLQQLVLHDLPELKQLITELESDAEQDQQVHNMVKEKVDGPHKPFIPLLPSLKYFVVSKCPQLEPAVIQQEVNNQPQVKGLYLSNRQCSSFDILLRQSLPHLEHLTVGNHLQFLRWLIISNCSKLKSLFPRMLAQSLPHLSYLRIEQCNVLKGAIT